MSLKQKLVKKGECMWELPLGSKSGMKVPARLVLSDKLLSQVEEGALEQVANVAALPGIHKHALAMPDMHFGYNSDISI